MDQTGNPEARAKANYTGSRPKDESKLSRKPSQIRNRLRRRQKTHSNDLEMLFATGYKPVIDWDIEELARGKPRNKNGGFQGRAPGWITTAVAEEAKKRLLTETLGGLSEHVTLAIKTIAALLKSEEVDDKGKPIVDARTKLAAATFIIEHVIGKPEAIVKVEAADFTRKILASAIVLDDGEPQDEPLVIEGQVVEDDDEEVEEDDDDDE